MAHGRGGRILVTVRMIVWCGCCVALVAGALAGQRVVRRPGVATPDRQAGRLVAQLELRDRSLDAVAGLVALGDAALGPLRRAIDDPRPDVVRRALFAIQGLGARAKPLLANVDALRSAADLGVRMAARRAAVSLAFSGRTLVADYPSSTVLEFDGPETRRWPGHAMVMDAERLPDGHLLIAEYRANKVRELDSRGVEVWCYEGVRLPSDADRLPGGNTLIADTGRSRVVEVDRSGKVVWSYADGIRPIDCDRLPNGNTLIASYRMNGVIEVDPSGEIVWQIANLRNARDADRLPDGTTLLAVTDQKVVRIVDADKRTLRELRVPDHPNDADLLPNGNILVAGRNLVLEFDREGEEVWRRSVRYAGNANRY